MAKRFFMLCLVSVLLNPLSAWAEKAQQNSSPVQEEVSPGRTEYQNLRTCLDFVVDNMTSLGLKFSDARVSLAIRSENWYEFPFELGWMGTQDTMALFLEKLFAYSFADSRVAQGAINISCSAETRKDGQVLLSITSVEKLMCYSGSEKDLNGNAAELWSLVSAGNQKSLRAIRSLLKVSTFNPQIRKIKENVEFGLEKTWLTNFRVDSDNRVQMTGYGLDPKQVTQLGEELFKSGSFVEVFIHNMTKNIYEKMPVWRFDITARVN